MTACNNEVKPTKKIEVKPTKKILRGQMGQIRFFVILQIWLISFPGNWIGL